MTDICGGLDPLYSSIDLRVEKLFYCMDLKVYGYRIAKIPYLG